MPLHPQWGPSDVRQAGRSRLIVVSPEPSTTILGFFLQSSCAPVSLLCHQPSTRTSDSTAAYVIRNPWHQGALPGRILSGVSLSAGQARTAFIRLVDTAVDEKATALLNAARALAHGTCSLVADPRIFHRDPRVFSEVPGSPFAYWVSDSIRGLFKRLDSYEAKGRAVKQGLVTADDFRFVRLWWEVGSIPDGGRWRNFAKGGAFSPYYADIPLLVGYSEGDQVGLQAIGRYGRGATHYYRPGLTWPLRTNGLSFRPMPAGCIFSHKGPAAFVHDDSERQLLAMAAILNSSTFGYLVGVQLARTELAQSYEVGLIQQTPVPDLLDGDVDYLAGLSKKAWSLMRVLDSTNECSRAFLVPPGTRTYESKIQRMFGVACSRNAIESELSELRAAVDERVFDLYGITAPDRIVIRDFSRFSTSHRDGAIEKRDDDFGDT